MNKQTWTLSVALPAIVLAVAACWGFGGATSAGGTPTITQGIITGFGSVFVDGATTPGGGTPATAHGITGLGSVFVDGVEYAVSSGTAVSVDGKNATESDLQVGMLVTVRGSVDAGGKTGTALSIEYTDQLDGVVTAAAVAADGTGSVIVMGQRVALGADTVFASRVADIDAPDLIRPGNVIEVSGYGSSDGAVTATRIVVKAASRRAGAPIEVKGTISHLDATAGTFTLGNLSVDYRALTAGVLPATGLANGQYVEVSTTAPFTGSSALIAGKIQLVDDGLRGHEGIPGEALEVKGLVTADLANTQFELNGRGMAVDSSTRTENGDATQLVVGTPVDVRARFNTEGRLVADSIDFKRAPRIQVAGTLQAVDPAAGTVKVLDRVVYVTNQTLMLDKSDAAVRYFGLPDLSPSNDDYLKLKAYVDSATGHLIATKLERYNGSTPANVAGNVVTRGRSAMAGVLRTAGDGNT